MEMSMAQRKEYIVLTAIDLIHEFGIQNISTKEIARRLEISEALVFKIFPKKNDILIAMLDQFSRYDNDMYQTAISKECSLEGIYFLINHIMGYYENYPAITSVYQILDIVKGIPEIVSKSKEIFLNRIEHLTQLAKYAQEAGKLEKSIDPELIADILLAIMKGMCIKWRYLNYGFSLQERTKNAITLFLNNITI